MNLLDDFRDEARRRGALGADESVTLASAFRVVRDLPWAEASDLRPETALAEWRGTGREKHLLLHAILDALGYETGLIAATCEFSPESAPWLPPALLEETRLAPVPELTLLLRVQTNRMLEEWMTLDATWPLATGSLGAPVNAEVDGYIEHPRAFRKIHAEEKNVAPARMAQVHPHRREFAQHGIGAVLTFLQQFGSHAERMIRRMAHAEHPLVAPHGADTAPHLVRERLKPDALIHGGQRTRERVARPRCLLEVEEMFQRLLKTALQ